MKVYLKKINQTPISFSEDELKEFTNGLSSGEIIYLQDLNNSDNIKKISISLFDEDFPKEINNLIISENAEVGNVLVLYQIKLNYYIINFIDSQDASLPVDGNWINTNDSEYSRYSNLIDDPDVLKVGFKTWLEHSKGKGRNNVRENRTQDYYIRFIKKICDNPNTKKCDIYLIFTKNKLDETINELHGNKWLQSLDKRESDRYFNSLNVYYQFFSELSTGILDFNLSNNDLDNTRKNNEVNSSSSNSLVDSKKNNYSDYPLNIILYGAPGTGKTYNTLDYAKAIIEHKKLEDVQNENRESLVKWFKNNEISLNDKGEIKEGQIVFVTFHQSYSYEDFIVGLKPYNDDLGNLKFRWEDGIFKKIADKARKDLEDNKNLAHNYVIIIDEINRANMSRVFGELITLLEADKREGKLNELSVILPSSKKFSVPKNLYVIGTMNTADKSIANIDVALRRRFTFIEQPVDSKILEDTTFAKVLNTINNDLKRDFDNNTDQLIGQAYFMNKSVNDLPDILNQSIIPLLYEYYDDDRAKVEEVVNHVINVVKKDVSLCENSSDYGRISVSLKNDEIEANKQ